MEETTVFLAPVFRGKRFDQHLVPLEVWPELTAYSEFVIAVARALFLAEHPERRRAPKGFVDGLRLGVRRIEGGSATPIIERLRNGALFIPGVDYFTRARDLLGKCVHEVGAGHPVPPEFPAHALSNFESFGRSLRPDEQIELAPAESTPGPVYTRAVRKAILLRQPGMTTYSQDVSLFGEVRAADLDNHSFRLVLPSESVSVRFTPRHEKQVTAALNDHRRVDVALVGIGTYDRNDKLLRVDSVEHLEPCESLRPFDTALQELSQLKDGWFDGEGLAPSQEAQQSLAILRNALDTSDLRIPHIYPTLDGGLQAEWSGPSDIEVTLEVMAEGSVLLTWSTPVLREGLEIPSDQLTVDGLLKELEKTGILA